MNKDINEAASFMETFNTLFEKNKSLIGENIECGFAIPAIDISIVKKLSKYNKYIGAENVYFLESGSVTGEISPSMAKSVGANFAIVGHSERRAIFHETDEIVNKKMKAVLAKGLTAVLCVGETIEQYKAGKTKDIVKTSITKALEGITDFSNVIIAYEPV
jgi:triosephosphate isomerase